MSSYIPVAQLIQELMLGSLKGQPLRTIVEFFDPDTSMEDASELIAFLKSKKVVRDEIKFWNEVEHWRKRRSIEKELGGWPERVTDFVELVAARWGVSAALNGHTIRGSVDHYTRIAFETDLRLETDRLFLPYSDHRIADAVDSWYRKTSAQIRARLRTQVAFDPSVDAELMWHLLEDVAFEVPIFDQKPATGFAAATIKKFMHSVKRKMHHRQLRDHIMPIIIGNQGSGKTTLVDALCAPLTEVKSEANFSAILDERVIDMWSNYIVVMNECSRATVSEIEGVKNRITGAGHSGRPMRTNAHVYVQNDVTFIGTANKTVNELLNDPTGMRRFVELMMKVTPGNEADWVKLNGLDWLAMWRSVDHEGPDPLAAFKNQLRSHSDVSRTPDVVEEWLLDEQRDEHRKGGEEHGNSRWPPGTWRQAQELWIDHFWPWLQLMHPNNRNMSSQLFHKRMKSLFKMSAAELGLRHKIQNGGSHWMHELVGGRGKDNVALCSTAPQELEDGRALGL